MVGAGVADEESLLSEGVGADRGDAERGLEVIAGKLGRPCVSTDTYMVCGVKKETKNGSRKEVASGSCWYVGVLQQH